MNSTTFNYLVNSDQVKSAILAQNPTANIFMSDAVVSKAIEAITGLTVVVYDKMYNDGTTDQNFFPDNVVTLLPEGKLGNLWYGTTPEERTAAQIPGVDVAMYDKGIAIATVSDYNGVAKTTITASEIVLPSFEGMNSVFVIQAV